MMGLGKRVDALEAIAEEVRLRPLRQIVDDLTREHRLTPEEAAEAFAAGRRCHEQIDRLRAQGLGMAEILERQATELGMPLAELRQRCDELAERYFS